MDRVPPLRWDHGVEHRPGRREQLLVAAPPVVLALVTAADLWTGQGSPVLGLVVVAPLVAALVYRPRAVAAFGVVALVLGVLG